MEFIPLHYPDRVTVINPQGDVGVVTLWSPIAVVQEHLHRAGVELDPKQARVAVLGTLYGEGLPEMLRNLLYNPQIRHLVLFGVDLGGSRVALWNFFGQGLEPTLCLGQQVWQIVGTHHKIDCGVLPEAFAGRLRLFDLGKPADPDSGNRLRAFFADLPAPEPVTAERCAVPLARFEVTRLPSDPRGHRIRASSPLAAWKELIHRLYRFGHRVTLAKGERIELQNVQVTITVPQEEPDTLLQEHGFDPEAFRRYQQAILSAALPPDQHYGYGNRLRGHFGTTEQDTLMRMVRLLTRDPDSRHAFVALWDTGRDLLSDLPGHPCLVSLFVRRFEEVLTLTALFRTHNALKAWLMNVHGLIAIQRLIATGCGLTPGPLTLISHSITIDPGGGGLDQARAIHDFRNAELRAENRFQPDPHGDFIISVHGENGMIVVDHRFEGQQLHRYTGRSAEELERQLVLDCALSDIGHALYLGRELGRAEARLKSLQRGKGEP
ncbi:MAG: hypothetical protein G8237_10310 [Magnetococcales bacterium]|nr:hypothetical protein [Magnetococcales bacterium]NGZ06738.1 hypothetical protein [Magnetococcales bacterium]